MCLGSFHVGSGSVPAVQQRPLVFGHVRQVAQRHRFREHRLLVDLQGLRPDALGRIELHALRRFGQALEGGFLGVATQAAGIDHALHVGESDAAFLRRSFRRSQEYGGAAPPPGHGPHRYIFTLYALNVDKLDVPDDASAAYIGFMINSAKLGEAKLVAKYER